MNFIATVARALLALLIVTLAVATATFFLMKAVPGGPFSRERQMPPEVRKAVEAKYRLNDPLMVQYGHYLLDAVRFDFGPSLDNPGRSVGEIIRQRLPTSAVLGGVALLISLGLAFPLGTGAAIKRDGLPDRVLAVAAAAGVSVPSFILGALLLYWFSYKFNMFRTGWGSVRQLVLPAISLAAMPTAYLSRLVRAGLAEVMRSEFILAARARGHSMLHAVVIHGLRHTLSPVFAYLGPQAAAIMTGSFVVERIFNIPGLGQMYVNSIANRDYPLIMGTTLVYAVVLVVFNTLSDVASRLLDPRLRGT